MEKRTIQVIAASVALVCVAAVVIGVSVSKHKKHEYDKSQEYAKAKAMYVRYRDEERDAEREFDQQRRSGDLSGMPNVIRALNESKFRLQRAEKALDDAVKLTHQPGKAQIDAEIPPR